MSTERGGETGRGDPNPTVDARVPAWLVRIWLGLMFTLTAISHEIAAILMNIQDRWLMLAQIALAGLVALWMRLSGRLPGERGPWHLSGRHALALAGVVVAVCWAGHYVVLCGYDLSRDEQMAGFDAAIYATRHLAAPLPALWQIQAAPLNQLFMLPVAHPVAWVSGYLPGNALVRMAVGLVADPALTEPLLTGIAVLATWATARQLWGDGPLARDGQVVSVMVLAASGMTLLMGMSAYAMPAHLAVNAVWLWLFLQERRRADLAAIMLGFLGTGLHQPLFHPLFVLPWLAWLVVDRRWARAGLFAGAYGAICLFWLWWPHLTLAHVVGPHSQLSPGGDFVTRLMWALGQNRYNFILTAANLLRFCTWQSLPMVPLLLYGLWRAIKAPRKDRAALTLAAGFVAPIVVMALLLPYQGHGFGYRYVHQVLGNAALLAGYGWQALAPLHARLRPVLVRAMVASLGLLLPMQCWLAYAMYAPYAHASARLSASGADYAIVGADDVPFALDLVLNRADLTNRPIRLSATDIDDPDVLAAHICHKGVTIAMPDESFYDEAEAYYHAPHPGYAAKRIAEDGPSYTNAGCRIIVLH